MARNKTRKSESTDASSGNPIEPTSLAAPVKDSEAPEVASPQVVSTQVVNPASSPSSKDSEKKGSEKGSEKKGSEKGSEKKGSEKGSEKKAVSALLDVESGSATSAAAPLTSAGEPMASSSEQGKCNEQGKCKGPGSWVWNTVFTCCYERKKDCSKPDA